MDQKNLLRKNGCNTGTGVMKLATIAVHMLVFIAALGLCNGLHILLRPYTQPRIISEAIVMPLSPSYKHRTTRIPSSKHAHGNDTRNVVLVMSMIRRVLYMKLKVGFFLSNLPFIRVNVDEEAKRTLSYVAEFGMICHMFIVGLEMDRNIFVKLPIRDAKVACSGVLITFLLAVCITPFLALARTPSLEFDVSLSIFVSGTASPLLTRIITDLKIAKSDIGQFIISTGVLSDLISTLIITLGYIISDPLQDFRTRDTKDIILMIIALLIQTTVAAKLVPLLMDWVNSENPQGKSIKGPHLIVSMATLVFVCSMSPSMASFNTTLSAFLAGVAMPREGRISKMMIGKFKYFFGLVFFPAFMFWVGFEVDFNEFKSGQIWTWLSLPCLFAVIVTGKVAGSVLSGVMLGFHWKESVAIGLLLSMKGHFHIFVMIMAKRNDKISAANSIALVLVCLSTFIYAPMVVKGIIERARKKAPTQRMALQWLNPSSELRIVLCLHGEQNVQSAINFMEISRGPPDLGMTVYVNDMIELTDSIASTLARGQGVDAMTVTDSAVIEMRENITNTIQAYAEENCSGVQIRRMLTLCPLSNMHQDICNMAEDLLVSMIILPFHKDQQPDGTLNSGHSGFRGVNRKVLRQAPCSVGILVERGLGSAQISRTTKSVSIAVIFIGGKDDREALAYAGRVARHPGVKLTVIRFLLETNGDSMTSKISRARANSSEYEEEMKQDDEYFAGFYDRHVATGHVSYMEKYLSDSGQTFSTIRSLEGQYTLFIVGRAGRVNTTLTTGMNDWEECPELGPIGDILSASDFSVTASVLIIQQHDLKTELQGIQDEFNIM